MDLEKDKFARAHKRPVRRQGFFASFFLAIAWVFGVAMISLLPTSHLHASVSIAFFEAHDSQGRPVPLEDGGRFFHVAISHNGQWLHADSWSGVRLEDDTSMSRFGQMHILRIADAAEPTEEEVAYLLGTRFDKTYTWDKPGTTYCSKLVGQLLRIAPRPMQFAGRFFSSEQKSRVGEPGLSPDDIYNTLLTRVRQNRLCERVFH